MEIVMSEDVDGKLDHGILEINNGSGFNVRCNGVLFWCTIAGRRRIFNKRDLISASDMGKRGTCLKMVACDESYICEESIDELIARIC